ncbi:hypothetical protein M3Y99_01471400 [Aphelenchoides fujianensis]|nr:hypothetical protein M3Y99_01471400 [Aphelenchoides fujianensis]
MFSSIYECVEVAIAVFTVLINVYIVYLIQFKTPQSMRNYRYFLNWIVISDVLFVLLLAPDEIEPLIGASMRGLVRTHEQASVVAILTVYAGVHVVCIEFYALGYRFTAILIDKRYQKVFLSTPGKLVVFLWNQSWCLLGVKDVLLVNTDYDRSTIRAGDPVFFIFWHRPYDHAFFLSLLAAVLLVFGILRNLKRNSNVFSATTKKLHVQFVTLFLISPYRQHCSANVIRPLVWAVRFLLGGCKRPTEDVEQQTAAVEPRTMSGAFALSVREDVEE